MRVIATKLGFMHGARVRIGQELDLDESKCKKDAEGNPVLPLWLIPATADARSKLSNAKRVEVERNKQAAVAAAGPKRSRRGFAVEAGAEDLV